MYEKETLDALNELFNEIFGRRLEMVVGGTAWLCCYRYEMLYKWLSKQEDENIDNWNIDNTVCLVGW